MTTHRRGKGEWVDWVAARDFLRFIEPHLIKEGPHRTSKWYLNGKHLATTGESHNDYYVVEQVRRGLKRRLLLSTAERIAVRYHLDLHELDEIRLQD